MESVNVFDGTGRLIFEKYVEGNSFQINVIDWSEGVYIIYVGDYYAKVIITK